MKEKMDPTDNPMRKQAITLAQRNEKGYDRASETGQVYALIYVGDMLAKLTVEPEPDLPPPLPLREKPGPPYWGEEPSEPSSGAPLR